MTTVFRSSILVVVSLLLISSSHAASSAADQSAWLGVLLADGAAPPQGGDLTEPVTETGVRVGAVFEGSPADQARLRSKDSIFAVNGERVSDASELMARVREVGPGSLVTLSVRRAGHELELHTVLAARPERTGRGRIVRGRIGVNAIELPPSLREHFGAPEDAGVLISEVVEGSPAEDSGIRVGDVVYEVDGEPVASVEELSRIVSQSGVENVIEIVLARDGARIVVEPQIERAP